MKEKISTWCSEQISLALENGEKLENICRIIQDNSFETVTS